jgi:hypothetical protein
VRWGGRCFGRGNSPAGGSNGDVAPERAADGFYSGEWGWGYS